MPRVLVAWSRPHHLSADEAERWARTEVQRLLAGAAVGAARLTRLESASPRLGCAWDWLAELEITVPAGIDAGACADWLADLRLLGMQPVVMLAASAIDLREEQA